MCFCLCTTLTVPSTHWRRHSRDLEQLLCYQRQLPMKLIHRCLPELLKQDPKGAIVNTCSTATVRGSVAGVAYTASKHVLLGLTRSTAWGCAREGIRCNAVIPGWSRRHADDAWDRSSGLSECGLSSRRAVSGLYVEDVQAG